MDIQQIRRRLNRLTSFSGPHLVPHETPTTLCPKVIPNEISKTNILNRFKNNRWKYCHCYCQCYQKLYPPPKWHYRFIWPLSRGPCFYAGEVDICPCFSIKFPDLRHLIDMVGSQEKDGPSDRSKYGDYHIFHKLRLDNVRNHMRHNRTQSLRVLTCYAIRGSPDILSQIFANAKALGHKDTAKWLRRTFVEAGSTFSGWHKNSYFLISSNRPEMPKGYEPTLLEISTVRNLGDGQWPNKQWKINVRS
ncbi:unnamed protein product [Penicillium camemberti]|uniref:Str. FM013 n=1 Tax=Penicillium camemberti (strain FM 013) TaxID=1429867 RepID=A0A0G4NVL3_PENC3|nr:unnamed protein product [Penicillium camemberti]